MTTLRTALVALIGTAFLFLLLNRNHLANKVDKTEAELVAEQATNTALGNIIDAYGANDAANRAATARQLENERKLRNESDERLRRFKAAGVGDSCIDSRMPDSNISILQE
ncbi:DUF2570 domain-containing protein [Yersinia kristensenii]|uniref:DUF2570 domain-containing protein n=1 Tax=Yersinia kristensenii TaxID=28152 RepID=UPI0028533945|nr:DUF2570 domain-containing protein [Yersinia kristensenii]MDR4897918.1 DUF2570 domain-containing protein [Yersinia kristensenii]MDX6737925.1 DUF2570 domain-containing protein [Yersinia kristensenii]